jgi:hypothetical protein
MTTSKTARIADLNDKFRNQMLEPKFFIPDAVPGLVVRTRGIASLPGLTQLDLMVRVRDDSAFTEDNDPHREHDFGCLTLDGVGKAFWKIDYYGDQSYTFGAEHPDDPAQSFRVLTIMLASEY